MSIRNLFIVSISGLLILLAVAVSVFIAVGTEKTITSEIMERRDALSEEVRSLLTVTDDLMLKRVENSLNLLTERGTEVGAASIQGSEPVAGVDAPALYLGDSLINNNFDLVDGVTRVMGGTATLFVRDGGDFIRVSTNVKKADGSRATGTKLNMAGAAGVAISRGEAYFGQVDILGNPYLTAYSPMKNASGKVVGIWYVGYSADLNELQQAITSSHLLENGFLALLDDRNRVRMHSDTISTEQLETVLAQTPDSWQLNRVEFEPWRYQVVTGYLHDEVSGIVRSEVLTAISVIVLGGLILIACLASLIHFVVSRPLNQMITSIQDIAEGEGDLTVRFNSEKKTELGLMAQGFDRLLDRLQATIIDTKNSSESLLTASGQLESIASGSSSKVAEQNEEIEQVATAMNEMTTTAQTVAESASRAENIAVEADALAESGRSSIDKTSAAIASQLDNNKASVETSAKLKEASGNIGSILSVIEGISEQTNLLALNAAIEAARAGEHGRGFAVVSEEVRRLASRTQESIKEIQSQILHLQDGVSSVSEVINTGSNLAMEANEMIKETGDAIEALRESVRMIRDTNVEMASAAEEQSHVSEDINKRLEHIRQIAGNSEENAGATNDAAQKLRELADQLQAKLEHYKT